MGLALAQRQGHAGGGEISAHNRIDDTAGLTIAISLPINATSTTLASV
jgi:two-component system sensor histidine kinase PfeS